MTNEGNPFQSPELEGVRGTCTSDSEVEFDHVDADGMWFALRENRQQHKTQILRIQIIFGSFALVGAMVALAILGSKGGDSFFVVPTLGAAAYFVYRTVFAKRIFVKAIRSVVERMLASRKSTGIAGRTTVRLEEEGFTVERPGGHIFWRWWAVPEVTSDEGYLLIYTAAVDACLVPARAFETDEHFSAFVANAKRLWEAKNRSQE